MGHTHYWRPEKNPSIETWTRITTAAEKVIELARAKGIEIVNAEGTPGTKPQFDVSKISLNGCPGYESLFLEREMPVRRLVEGHGRFASCKTNKYSYDVVVTAILVLVEHLTDDTWCVCSDGVPAEWAVGLALAREVLPEVQLPPEVSEG